MAIQDGSAQFEKKTVTNKEYVDLCVPVGVVQAFAGNTLPDGWLACDGSAVSRTTYADLYAVIGDTYGAGDGNTTFNLPNLVDKFIEGSSTSGTEKSAGLPNITGTITSRTSNYSETKIVYDGGGAFYRNDYNQDSLDTMQQVNDKGRSSNTRFDASRSNNIYGNSTTVQPPAVTMRYIIKY